MWAAIALADAVPCRQFVCKDPVDPANLEVCAEIEKKSSTLWIEYVGKCGILALRLD